MALPPDIKTDAGHRLTSIANTKANPFDMDRQTDSIFTTGHYFFMR